MTDTEVFRCLRYLHVVVKFRHASLSRVEFVRFAMEEVYQTLPRMATGNASEPFGWESVYLAFSASQSCRQFFLKFVCTLFVCREE